MNYHGKNIGWLKIEIPSNDNSLRQEPLYAKVEKLEKCYDCGENCCCYG